MYAQLGQGGTTPDKRPEMDRFVTAELIPALHDEPGFGGALNPDSAGRSTSSTTNRARR
jgi:hypothetical protein